MECLTFQRRKLAVPNDMAPELTEHARRCAACTAFARKIDDFERQLYQVARVQVPEGLAEQIVLRHRRSRWWRRGSAAIKQALAPARSERSGPLLRYAALASVAFGVTLALAVVGFYGSGGHQALADSMIAHVVSEPGLLQARDDVEPQQLNLTLARYGAAVEESVGQLRHAGDCVIDGVVGQHLVLQTSYGRVTLLLLPERVGGREGPRTKDGYTAIVLPLRGGSLGIVADTPRKASDVESLLKPRLRHTG
jgi:hypothetical protein